MSIVVWVRGLSVPGNVAVWVMSATRYCAEVPACSLSESAWAISRGGGFHVGG